MTKRQIPSGDYVLLRYIEAPQVKSFTLPSLGSHEVRVREHETRSAGEEMQAIFSVILILWGQ